MSTDQRIPLAMKALEDFATGKTSTFSQGDAAIVLEATKTMSGTIMKQMQLLALIMSMLPQIEAAAVAINGAISGLSNKLAQHIGRPARGG